MIEFLLLAVFFLVLRRLLRKTPSLYLTFRCSGCGCLAEIPRIPEDPPEVNLLEDVCLSCISAGIEDDPWYFYNSFNPYGKASISYKDRLGLDLHP